MKRLDLIENEADWRKRLNLAENKTPGTPFDSLFESAGLATELHKEKHFGNAQQNFMKLGCWLADVIASGESQKLHDMARALNIWKQHKPELNETDEIRKSLIALHGMFTPGKRRMEVVNGKIELREAYGKISVRDVMNSLKNHGVQTDENTPGKIRREAKALKYQIGGSAGRPKIKGTKSE